MLFYSSALDKLLWHYDFLHLHFKVYKIYRDYFAEQHTYQVS